MKTVFKRKGWAMLTVMLLLPMMVLGQTEKATGRPDSGNATLRHQMDWLHQRQNVNFVYDATINIGQPYKGPSLNGLALSKALRTLFDGTGIDYRQNGKYVMLFEAKSEKKGTTTYTISGYVRDSIGETLINGTVYDLTTGQGTMTNQHGYYSLTLPEGDHLLRISFVGYAEQTQRIVIHRNQTLDITLNENARLGEVVITGDLNSPVSGTQMGKHSLSQTDIKTEFALLSSPDVVKTLQRISGVQEGVELASGLYVHGGNNDENLFLIDGTPLYQINHSLGLFSAFNVDVVKNVDFYKSGFPARYGGRLSSVTDVRTNDGNMQKWHGSYRIGLLDGGIQVDGPIKKGKTSLNVGLRRSWADLLSEPIFFIQRQSTNDEQIRLNYNFHDLNAKLTHIINDRNRLSLSLYSGGDALTSDYKTDGAGYGIDQDHTKNQLRWGNVNVALNWNMRLNPKLMGNLTAIYTHNRANIFRMEEWRYQSYDDEPMRISYNEHAAYSTIDDVGYRTEFDYRPTPRHHIRFGHDYTLHAFHPQTTSGSFYYSDSEGADSISRAGSNRHTSHELNLYAEDQLTLSDCWSLNGGINLSLFSISGKTFIKADPRLAVKYQISNQMSLKASYTMMTQYVHKITNSFLDMPTDYWVPTTQRLKPMHSQQWAVGLYTQLNTHLSASVEGYYKMTNHLLQYTKWNGLEPPATSWDQEVTDGRGRFYGVEADVNYRSERISLDASYTLSWNERKFPEFYPNWYYDKFDNRHKLNLTGRFKLSRKTEMYAAWTLHSGNRMTLPTQYVQLPMLPTDNERLQNVTTDYGKDTNRQEFIYERPNNIRQPLYHRLDVGFNFFHTTKHGHLRIWNLSLYNAYCHLNTLWTEVKGAPHDLFRVSPLGGIPIIPSFSYTIKW